MGSGCGSVGREVASVSDIRGSNPDNFIYSIITMKIETKRLGLADLK